MEERNGTLMRRFDVAQLNGDVVVQEVRFNHKRTTSLVSSFISVLQNTFLPEGYPHSVSSDYASYQFWDTIQALCSSLTGTLSTRSVLKGVGVGDAGATVLSGTLSWVLRDFLGMIGRICFASVMGSNLDCDAKFWRFIADITNDAAMCVEIFSAFLPTFWFVTMLCIASLLKAVTGVAGGSSRASLTTHFAIRHNAADVSAKDGSQETASTMLGMIVGFVVAALVPVDSLSGTLAVFVFFTCAHLSANYLAVRSLVLEQFNSQRLEIAVDAFLNNPSPSLIARPNTPRSSSGGRGRNSPGRKGRNSAALVREPPVSSPTATKLFPSPTDVSKLEGILFRCAAAQRVRCAITVGASLMPLLGSTHVGREGGSKDEEFLTSRWRMDLLASVRSELDDRRVAVLFDAKSKEYYVVLSDTHTLQDVFVAYTQVLFFHARSMTARPPLPSVMHGRSGLSLIESRGGFGSVAREVDQFCGAAKSKGWVVDRALIRNLGWTVKTV